MRESIANSYIFTLVILFVGIMMILLITSISMSKIFKIRNRVVDIVETNRGFNHDTYEEIENVLTDAGYTPELNKVSFVDACSKFTTQEQSKDSKATLINGSYQWNAHTYCIYEHKVDRGVYYTVYVRLEYSIPIIGAMVPITSKADTRVLSNLF